MRVVRGVARDRRLRRHGLAAFRGSEPTVERVALVSRGRERSQRVALATQDRIYANALSAVRVQRDGRKRRVFRTVEHDAARTELGAIAEHCSGVYRALKRRRQVGFRQRAAAVKRLVPNLGDVRRQDDLGQVIAPLESLLADRRQVHAEVDAHKVLAPVERILADRRRIVQGDADQLLAPGERIIADARDGAIQRHALKLVATAQKACRQRSDARSKLGALQHPLFRKRALGKVYDAVRHDEFAYPASFGERHGTDGLYALMQHKASAVKVFVHVFMLEGHRPYGLHRPGNLNVVKGHVQHERALGDVGGAGGNRQLLKACASDHALGADLAHRGRDGDVDEIVAARTRGFGKLRDVDVAGEVEGLASARIGRELLSRLGRVPEVEAATDLLERGVAVRKLEVHQAVAGTERRLRLLEVLVPPVVDKGRMGRAQDGHAASDRHVREVRAVDERGALDVGDVRRNHDLAQGQAVAEGEFVDLPDASANRQRRKAVAVVERLVADLCHTVGDGNALDLHAASERRFADDGEPAWQSGDVQIEVAGKRIVADFLYPVVENDIGEVVVVERALPDDRNGLGYFKRLRGLGIAHEHLLVLAVEDAAFGREVRVPFRDGEAADLPAFRESITDALQPRSEHDIRQVVAPAEVALVYHLEGIRERHACQARIAVGTNDVADNGHNGRTAQYPRNNQIPSRRIGVLARPHFRDRRLVVRDGVVPLYAIYLFIRVFAVGHTAEAETCGHDRKDKRCFPQ